MEKIPDQASTVIPYIALFVDALQWVSWPVSIVLVAMIFKNPLGKAIDKLAGISYGNVKAEFANQPSNVESLESPLSTLSGSDESKKLTLIERNLSDAQRTVRDHVINELEAFSESEKIPVLTASVAFERLQKHFALAYSNIFGSQIRTLELLNQRGLRISVDDASSQFVDLQKSHVEFKDWTLERYLSYLRNFNLVYVDEDTIGLTPIGKDFIIWLDNLGLDKNRPL